MRICVVGAGAIGGVLAVRLALAGEEVMLLVRSEAQLSAITGSGLALIEADGARRVARGLAVVRDAAEAGTQDAVILAVKAHHVAALVPGIRALFHPETVVVTLQNGIPWWYFQRLSGPRAGLGLASLDPDGAIAAAIPPERILGAVTYIAAERLEPALVRHGGGDRLPLGELDGSRSARAERLAGALARAGVAAPILPDIRAELWLKLWGNACFNPLGALTHATVGGISSHPASRDLVIAMMEELSAVAASLGVVFRQSAAQRVAEAVGRVAQHKPSMLQDVEAGRALEVDAIASAVVELAGLTGTPIPHFAAVHACVKLLDATMAAERCGFAAVARPGNH